MVRAPLLLRVVLGAGLAATVAGSGVRAQLPRKTSSTAAAETRRVDVKKAKKAYEAALRAEKAGDWPTAFDGYAQAAGLAPGDAEYQLRRELARFQLVQQHMQQAERAAVAGRLEQARQELQDALTLDPGYDVARERLAQIDSLSERLPIQLPEKIEGEVKLQPQPGKRSFNFRGDTEAAFEEVARQFGVTVAFDPDLARHPVRFRVDDVDFPTAMRLLDEIAGTFWRPVNSHLFFVAQDTEQKRKDYGITAVRSVSLPGSDTPSQMTETLRLVREIAGINRTELDLPSHTLTMRASPGAIALALDIIQQAEQVPGELLLDIEVLEVNLNAARQLGITPPSSARIFSISPTQIKQAEQSTQGLVQVITDVFGAPSAISGLQTGQIGALLGSGQLSAASLIPPLVAFGGGQTTFLATLPGAAAQFAQVLSLVRSGQRVLLRAEDGRPATFFVGDRFPVSLATLSPSLGSAQFIPQVSSSSFPRTDFVTGTAPIAVITGDFKGDSHADLAVADQSANTVSILLNNGSGGFGAKTDFATGTGPVALAAADLNNDKNIDLVVADDTANTISVLLGNGDGTFKPKTDIATGNSPDAIVIGDFNGDSVPDVVVANKASNTVSVFLGVGDGTFQPKMDFPTGNAPVSLVAGDFNGDGKLDLAVANQTDNTVSILLGKGDGTFGAKTDFLTGTGAASVTAADLTANGRLDLAVANQTANTISILLGNGDGTFQPKVDFATGNSPISVATADFNSDGFPDLAIANQSDNTVSALINNGSAGFAFRIDLPVGSGPSSVTMADFNGDGRPDLASANQTANTVSVILNSTTLVNGQAATQTAYPSAEYVDLGLKVKATPRLHPDDEVTLKMEFEIHSLAGQAFNGIPVISNRTIEQTVRLREGETTALAGVLQPQESLTITGTPGLERQLGNRNSQKQDTELLILVTPRLIRMTPRVNHSFYAGRSSSGAEEGSDGPP